MRIMVKKRRGREEGKDEKKIRCKFVIGCFIKIFDIKYIYMSISGALSTDNLFYT